MQQALAPINCQLHGCDAWNQPAGPSPEARTPIRKVSNTVATAASPELINGAGRYPLSLQLDSILALGRIIHHTPFSLRLSALCLPANHPPFVTFSVYFKFDQTEYHRGILTPLATLSAEAPSISLERKFCGFWLGGHGRCQLLVGRHHHRSLFS